MPIRVSPKEVDFLRERNKQLEEKFKEFKALENDLANAKKNFSDLQKKYDRLDEEYDEVLNKDIWEAYDKDEVMTQLEIENPDITLIYTPTLTATMDAEAMREELYKKHNINFIH